MSSPPPQDLWLERSRFNGMLLDGISYGIIFVLTIQCVHALMNKPHYAGDSPKTATRRRNILLLYLFVTFALATIGVAGNAKYSQMIWIDLRGSPVGPAGLIVNELFYWENRMALASNYIMSWLMDVLLLHRCFVIWNWHVGIVILMSSLLLANIVMATMTLVISSRGVAFTSINFQLAYLAISVSTNFLYTILVAGRLLAQRKQIVDALGKEHSKVYTSVAALVVESAALYSGFGVYYVVTFALHSNAENLILLWIAHAQAIAQLLIILRVAKGRAYTQNVTAMSVSIDFAAPSAHMTQSQPSGLPTHHTHISTQESYSVPSLPSVGQTKQG